MGDKGGWACYIVKCGQSLRWFWILGFHHNVLNCVCVCGGGWDSCIAVSGASTLRDVNFVIRSGQLSGCCVTLNALLKFMEIIVVLNLFLGTMGYDGWVWIGLWNSNIEKYIKININMIRITLLSLFFIENIKYYLDYDDNEWELLNF